MSTTARDIAREIATDLALDIEGAEEFGNGAYVALIERIEQAILAERERCATIAEGFEWTLTAGNDNIPMIDIDALAQAIRGAS
jgi:hypothetical protein